MSSAPIGSYRATNVPVLDVHEIVPARWSRVARFVRCALDHRHAGSRANGRRERAFLDAVLERGEIDASSLDVPEPLRAAIDASPALQWKAQNVKAWKSAISRRRRAQGRDATHRRNDQNSGITGNFPASADGIPMAIAASGDADYSHGDSAIWLKFKFSLAKLERHFYAAADMLRREGMDAATYKNFIIRIAVFETELPCVPCCSRQVYRIQNRCGNARGRCRGDLWGEPCYYHEFFVPGRTVASNSTPASTMRQCPSARPLIRLWLGLL